MRFDVAELPVVLAVDTYPDIVLTSPNSKIKTVEQLLQSSALTRVRIADYSGLVLGLASTAVVAKQRHLLTLQPVTFSVYPEAHVAVLRGDVDLITRTGSGTTLRFFESGEYISLLVWGLERFAALPNVPTSAELGLPEQLNGTRQQRVCIASPKTPKAVIESCLLR